MVRELLCSPSEMLALAPTVGVIERFMVEDHVRIDHLLKAATQEQEIDTDAYGLFRHDLLRHIVLRRRPAQLGLFLGALAPGRLSANS
jgi:hypothetical protein